MEGKTIGWDNRYSVGIPLIDDQHREILRITNNLYMACLKNRDQTKDFFREAVYGAVNYIKYHVSAEELILEKMGYPDILSHKKQHEGFLRNITAEVQSYENGTPMAPNSFVRFLRDWVLTHIAFIDKKYATYLQIIKDRDHTGAAFARGRGHPALERYLKPEYLPPPEMFWG